jgi:GT2 family glycosyltransferase
MLVVVREADKASVDLLNSKYPFVKQVMVEKPGQVDALNAGVERASGEIVAFTDDDCVPYPDWLAKIEAHFLAGPKVGGVGGRDRIFIEDKEVAGPRCQVPGARCQVGKITWYGRIIGNSHLGTGEAREVDHLKGANMSFRKEALEGIRFDEHLRGEGAQYRNDLALCLAVKKKGWKIIYDPKIIVDHFYAARFEKDKRGNFDLAAIENAAFNETLIALKYMDLPRMLACLFYSFFIGDLFMPGIVQFARIILTGGKNPVSRFLTALNGRLQAFKLNLKPNT